MTGPSPAPANLILKIEVEGTYSRSSPCFNYDEAMESDGNQSVGRLEVTISEAPDGDENAPAPEILHHSVIEDPKERIKSNEVLLAPPSNGTYITTFWSSSLNTEIELPKPPPYFLTVTETGVEIGGTIFTWRDIENNANWPHEDHVTTYVNGEVATPWYDDVWNAIVSSDDYCVRLLGPILLVELDFLVGHGRLESGLTCPTQITREALTRPDVLHELALSMPWEYARHILGPVELKNWLEENHPESSKRRLPILQTPPTPKTVDSSASNPPTPFTPEGELALNAMLGTMRIKGVLTDEMINQQEGEIILGQPFSQWPPELQQKLIPFGAGPVIR